MNLNPPSAGEAWRPRLLATLLVLLPAVSNGQYTKPDTPADSPLWWPLFDGITAADLREEHQADAVKARYAAAVQRGEVPDCGPEYVPGKYVDSGVNPELVPLWYSLDQIVFSHWTIPEDHRPSAESLNAVLRRAGLSDYGITAFSDWGREAATEIGLREAALEEDLAPSIHAVEQFLERHPLPTDWSAFSRSAHSAASEALGRNNEVTSALEGLEALDDLEAGRGDPLVLSTVMEGSYSDWYEWVALWEQDINQTVLAEALPRLRSALSDGDWLSLRRYLATTVGSGRSETHSFLECPDANPFNERSGEPAR